MIEKQLTATDLARIATERQLLELELLAVASRLFTKNAGKECLMPERDNKK